MSTATIDMQHGEGLRERVVGRRNELEELLARDDLEDRARADARDALDGLGLILGEADLDHLPAMTVAQLNDWLEKSVPAS